MIMERTVEGCDMESEAGVMSKAPDRALALP